MNNIAIHIPFGNGFLSPCRKSHFISMYKFNLNLFSSLRATKERSCLLGDRLVAVFRVAYCAPSKETAATTLCSWRAEN